MKLFFTEPFKRDYAGLPANVKKALDKALKFLSLNPRHPSLRAKNLPGTDIAYARFSRAHRFTFQIRGDAVILRRAGPHEILNRERKS